MLECDLVMKGGTTSGVVYPFAITEISKVYRLRSIAGTSAGAIAATLAAAAEYRRQTALSEASENAGFEAIEDIATELADDMMSLLQPSLEMAPLFQAFETFLDEEKDARLSKRERTTFEKLKGPLTVLFLTWGQPERIRTKRFGLGGHLVKTGLSFGLPGAAAVGIFGFRRWKRIFSEIPEAMERNKFGVLPGTTQAHYPNAGKQGVIDWLANKIDTVAGHGADGDAAAGPLLIGHLNGSLSGIERSINLATITTDLTSQRPYRLPLNHKDQYYFDPQEIAEVLPQRVVDWMIEFSESTKKRVTIDSQKRTLYAVPVGDYFPVVLAARMSLSFPFLIAAVPLWRQDHLPHAGANKTKPWVRCLFSDGGLSSNLPVHLFDAWLPQRPTFAIALSGYEKERHGTVRVHLPKAAPNPLHIDTIKIDSLPRFLFSLLTAAKDWQDKLQSRLPGFAERVATVRLKAHEGGQNLKMERETIEELQNLGREAGQKVTGNFDFEQNRWHRALSIFPQLDASIQVFRQAYEDTVENQEDTTYRQVFLEANYEGVGDWAESELVPYADAISALSQGIAPHWSHRNVPTVDAEMRLVSNLDLTEN